MNKEPMILSDVLTIIAYVVLAGLGIWLLAHILSVVACIFSPPWRQWAAQSATLAAELRRLADRTKGLVWDHAHAGEVEDEDRRANLIRQEFASLRAKGPERGMVAWLGSLTIPIDAPFRTAIEVAERMGWTESAAAADEALDGDLARWHSRLGLLIAAGPPAGSAPTCSGATSFLMSYADKAQQGANALSLAGIRDALLTTYAGCSIAVAGIVLLAIVSGLYRRSRPELARALYSVKASYEEWLGVTRDAQAAIGEEERTRNV